MVTVTVTVTIMTGTIVMTSGSDMVCFTLLTMIGVDGVAEMDWIGWGLASGKSGESVDTGFKEFKDHD